MSLALGITFRVAFAPRGNILGHAELHPERALELGCGNGASGEGVVGGGGGGGAAIQVAGNTVARVEAAIAQMELALVPRFGAPADSAEGAGAVTVDEVDINLLLGSSAKAARGGGGGAGRRCAPWFIVVSAGLIVVLAGRVLSSHTPCSSPLRTLVPAVPPLSPALLHARAHVPRPLPCLELPDGFLPNTTSGTAFPNPAGSVASMYAFVFPARTAPHSPPGSAPPKITLSSVPPLLHRPPLLRRIRERRRELAPPALHVPRQLRVPRAKSPSLLAPPPRALHVLRQLRVLRAKSPPPRPCLLYSALRLHVPRQLRVPRAKSPPPRPRPCPALLCSVASASVAQPSSTHHEHRTERDRDRERSSSHHHYRTISSTTLLLAGLAVMLSLPWQYNVLAPPALTSPASCAFRAQNPPPPPTPCPCLLYSAARLCSIASASAAASSRRRLSTFPDAGPFRALPLRQQARSPPLAASAR
ncbi:hypothetical protein C8F04DRAFT_1271627 [Mycena alexandri]|uniref:Uncharacterized protein n=1 Tax=Mycena alexandri TaxID=1745969 RepID=A0AAD6WVZ2_9AGAR|nr:hypothetical protein C8F04DRAFT_1271627 [Mycena alexandri]